MGQRDPGTRSCPLGPVQALGWGEAGAARAPSGLPRSRRGGGCVPTAPQQNPPAQHALPAPLPRKQSRTSSCGRNKRLQPKRQNPAPMAARTSLTRRYPMWDASLCWCRALEHPFPGISHPAALRLPPDEAGRQQPGSVSLCPPSGLNLGKGKGPFPARTHRSPHSVPTTVTYPESQAAADGHDR